MMENKMIQDVAHDISNFIYWNNLEATKQLMELFDTIANGLHRKLGSAQDYVNMYDDNFYTYETWEELVDSEIDQTDGLTEEELKRELEDNVHGSVWQLPCGWFVQYV